MVSETRNKGFSLIELLVVTTVIVSLTGLAISNYTSFTDVQKIRQAGRTLKNNLRFVQTRATSGVKPVTCDDTNPLSAYRVTFTATTYSYQAVCSTGVAGTMSSISLPNGLSFSPLPAAFDFRVLTGSATRDTILILTNSSRSYAIQINGNGNIEDLGFQ